MEDLPTIENDNRNSELFPWENPSLGYFRRFWDTAVGVIFKPWQTFARMPVTGGYLRPWCPFFRGCRFPQFEGSGSKLPFKSGGKPHALQNRFADTAVSRRSGDSGKSRESNHSIFPSLPSSPSSPLSRFPRPSRPSRFPSKFPFPLQPLFTIH